MSTRTQNPSPRNQSQATTSRPYRQPRNAWAIVTRREIMAKLTDKAFITGTLTTLGLILAVLAVQVFLSNRGSHETIVVTDDAAAGVVASAHEVEHAKNENNEVKTLRVGDEAAAHQAVTNGDADAYLHQKDGRWTLTFERDVNSTTRSTIEQVVAAKVMAELGQKAGLTPQQLAEQTSVQTSLLDGSEDRSMLAQVFGFAFAILFFMSAMTFGMQIAGSVVEEKASRVVEIISAAIPIRHLLAGKILGNTALGFAQMLLFSIVGLVGISFTSFRSLLPTISGDVVWYLLYFVAGFLALACIWAVAGSLASRQEDLQSTTTPLIMILMIVYMAGLFASGTLQTVLSYFPVISSVLMPARLVGGTAQWYDLVIGLVVNLAFAVVTVLFGEKIYRRSLLQTSGAISYRDALKLTD